MNAYNRMVIRQRKWMLYILAIAVLGWGFTEYTQIFQSLILGLAGGFYNLFLMQKKIDLLGERVSKNEKAQSLGMISRFAVARSEERRVGKDCSVERAVRRWRVVIGMNMLAM